LPFFLPLSFCFSSSDFLYLVTYYFYGFSRPEGCHQNSSTWGSLLTEPVAGVKLAAGYSIFMEIILKRKMI